MSFWQDKGIGASLSLGRSRRIAKLASLGLDKASDDLISDPARHLTKGLLRERHDQFSELDMLIMIMELSE